MRTWRLDLDTVRVEGTGGSGLEIAFEVSRTLGSEPNSCSVRVWNLAREQRAAIEALAVRGKQPGKIRTQLHAGSTERGSSLLFSGDLRYARSERDGADWVTIVEGDDGGRAHVDARVERSFPPGTRVDQVVRACADALGLGLGNLPQALTGATLAFDQGMVLSGRASDQLKSVLKRVGLTYSVQHGVLQVLRAGQPLNVPAVLLKPGSGLVGSPTRNADGRVECTALLTPGLDPGARVRVESQNLTGDFFVRQVRFQGDASGNDWYAHLELKT